MDLNLIFENIIKQYPNFNRFGILLTKDLYQEYCKLQSIELEEDEVINTSKVNFNDCEFTIMHSCIFLNDNASDMYVIPIPNNETGTIYSHYRYKDFKLEHDQVISFIDTCANK